MERVKSFDWDFRGFELISSLLTVVASVLKLGMGHFFTIFSYPMGTRGFFPGIKQPGREADHSPPSSAEVKEWVELYLHSPNTPSWRGAQLKHRDSFTFG
jgi:hypothetical protein